MDDIYAQRCAACGLNWKRLFDFHEIFFNFWAKIRI